MKALRHPDIAVWPRSLARAGAGFVLLSAIGGCGTPVLDPQGPIGAGDRLILIDSIAVMLCIVVPTIAAVPLFAWWFRAGNSRARYRPGFTFSGRLELIMWAIPLLIILFLGGIAWVGSHELDPGKPIVSKQKTIDIEVVSLDWKWLFIYPEQGIASVNRLTLPAGVPVHFHITSASVMNAFFIPKLGSMIYAMNGMETPLYLQADHPGVYPGLSSHFSGDGFAGMHFDAVALPPAAFAAWAASVHSKAGPTLDDAAYRTLEQQTSEVVPYTYRAVRPGLFGDITMQRLPAGPGPQSGESPAPATPNSGSK